MDNYTIAEENVEKVPISKNHLFDLPVIELSIFRVRA